MSWVRIPLDPLPLLVLKYDPPHYTLLKISYDEINHRNDPYQLFLDNIKSPHTARKYKNSLEVFLRSIPDQVYEKISKTNQDVKILVKAFVSMAKKSPELTTNIIATYIKEEKKLVESNQLSSGTLENHIKPIKVLLDTNRIAIHWKSLHKLYPRKQNATEDRAYTKQELQKMLEAARDMTDKVIITVFSSGGFRLEAWNYFTWKDYITFKAKDGSFKGGSLLVYRGDPESYWTFITPEACEMLELYRQQWKSEIGDYPKPDDPPVKTVRFPVVRRLNAKGVRKRIEKIVAKIGLRPPLPAGKKRHEVQLDHGFRKYFNTMMRRAKVNYLDKEDMTGHKVGLERHYERYQEEDFERFPEYQKAISFLTISDEERLRFENQQKQKDLDELEKNSTSFQEITKRLDDVENGFEARKTMFQATMYKLQGKPLYQVFAILYQILFEMSAPEDKKRNIRKKIQDAAKRGEEIDFSPLGDPKDLSWENLMSSLPKTELEQ